MTHSQNFWFWVGEAKGFTFLISQKMLMLLLRGLHFEKHWTSVKTTGFGTLDLIQPMDINFVQGLDFSFFLQYLSPSWGFPGGSDGKEVACSVGDLGSIPGSGRSPGEGNANPLQYSCLENSMDRRAWQATVHGVIGKSQMRLSD